MSLIRGRRYNRLKKIQGGDHKSKGQNDTLINQADRLAKEHGVSPATIKRDGKIGEFLREMEKNKGGDPVSMAYRVEEPPTLAEIGVTKNLSSEAQTLAGLPEEEFEERLRSRHKRQIWRSFFRIIHKKRGACVGE